EGLEGIPLGARESAQSVARDQEAAIKVACGVLQTGGGVHHVAVKTMSRLLSPISPLITGPAWRAARRRGATPNSRSNAGATASSAAAIAKKQAIGRASPRASAAVHVTTISSPTYW